jgi:prepilin-type processing-associated H-X9-DG protein
MLGWDLGTVHEDVKILVSGEGRNQHNLAGCIAALPKCIRVQQGVHLDDTGAQKLLCRGQLVCSCSASDKIGDAPVTRPWEADEVEPFELVPYPPSYPPLDVRYRWLLRRPRCASFAARSKHNGGVQTAYCDGGVQFISDSIDLSVWQAAGTVNGGETLTP